MRTVLLVVSLFALLAVAMASGAYLWWSMAEVEIGIHGLIALVLGAVFSLALGGGLMGLVFYSSRKGHDDRQQDPWS